MALKNTHKYDDIIDLPHPICQRASRMTNYDRAAQFSPFAALTGFEAAIEETARLTDTRIELTEGEILRYNEILQEIQDILPGEVHVRVTYFVYDERKAGGAYVTACGQVRKIDIRSAALLLTDGTAIPIREILTLEIVDEGM